MNKQKHQMKISINALHGAASGIASAIDSESISSEQVYGLLTTIADRMTIINNQLPQHLAKSEPDG